MNTGIPFKQSISCLILLWSHTYLCWSSFFSAQAQSGKRSEKNSSRAAVWPSTPNCSNSSLKIEMKSKQGVATLCDLSLASAWALLSHLFNLLPELSKSYLWFILSQPSEPWTERPSICRTGSRVTGIIKPEPSYGPCGASSPNLCLSLWPPLLKPSPSLHCPPCGPQTHVACPCCTGCCHCLQSLGFCVVSFWSLLYLCPCTNYSDPLVSISLVVKMNSCIVQMGLHKKISELNALLH